MFVRPLAAISLGLLLVSVAAAENLDQSEFSPKPGPELELASEEPLGAPPNGAQYEPELPMSMIRFFNGLYYHRIYRKINDYLVSRVPHAGLAANIAAVRARLEHERAQQTNPLSRALHQPLVEAYGQLADLGEIDETNRCNRNSFAILWRNDQATEGRAHVRPSKLSQAPRRIDSLVHEVSLRHAIDCHLVYPQSYHKLRAQMNQTSLSGLENFLNAVVADWLRPRSLLGKRRTTFDPIELLKSVKSLGSRRIARVAYDTIAVLSLDDPDRKFLDRVPDERRGAMVVEPSGVQLLVRRYLSEPCLDYLHQLGPDVFIPARYDARMLEPADRYRAEGSLLTEFITGWINYRLCEILVARDEPALVRGVAALAARS